MASISADYAELGTYRQFVEFPTAIQERSHRPAAPAFGGMRVTRNRHSPCDGSGGFS